MEKKSYVVTDVADINTKIAGKRRLVGSKLLLTEAEAEWELKRNLIKPTAAPEAKKPAKE